MIEKPVRAVAGAGVMGHGIAMVLGMLPSKVWLYDVSDDALELADGRLADSLAMLTRKGLVTEAIAATIRQRIHLTTSLEQAVGESAFVIEAAPEDVALKQELWAKMDELAAPEAIIATNSSAIPLSDIGVGVKHRDRIVGSHFMLPPHVIPVVEVSRGAATTDETMDTTAALWESCGKVVARIEEDVSGYIVNRLQAALGREAMHLIEIGAATPQAIDAAVKSGFGLRWMTTGPMEHRDMGGLDVSMRFSEFMWPVLTNATEPFEGMRAQVERGEHGLKVGKGLYDWSGQDESEVRRERAERLIDTVVQFGGWKLPDGEWDTP